MKRTFCSTMREVVMLAGGLLAAAFVQQAALADDASNIPPAYREIAGAVGVPADVLYAIALTESGTQLRGGSVRPWPWTLNVAGTPHRFATRREAFASLDSLIRAGRRNIDIGLAQMNWGWNGHRFDDAWSALDPHTNLEASARLLRDLHMLTGDWGAAAERYYGATDKKKRSRYRKRFERNRRRANS